MVSLRADFFQINSFQIENLEKKHIKKVNIRIEKKKFLKGIF